ncbi:sulfite exporter TauE/SafE family protein [Amantichitinum ursilacus]|uniref:Urease accessory protein UreH-like transmembrane domain-containing protein n=1 Tax=Amantichitinum ursilacus TaxID=857265 RepID=A0A0N0GR89_9NEIS|nr:sulfite exporter TauE/SafE family protein [Amantichitinum ursilacus]KPC55441.1 hypothetical protein WG78_02250 [Amantichitinum ursilacus]
MLHNLDLFAYFLAGLLGGGHCFGMCGGIVTAFSLQLPPGPRLKYYLGFNFGRIAGYALIGVLAGALGSIPALISLQGLKTALFVLANLLLIGMGLYMAGWSTWVARLEMAGRPVWRKVQPLLARLLPVRHWYQTPLIGALWGWLPCGLVYTASLGALASGSPGRGALTMLVFGLGTLPNLLLIGFAASATGSLLRKQFVRRAAGILLILFALYQLIQGLGFNQTFI